MRNRNSGTTGIDVARPPTVKGLGATWRNREAFGRSSGTRGPEQSPRHITERAATVGCSSVDRGCVAKRYLVLVGKAATDVGEPGLLAPVRLRIQRRNADTEVGRSATLRPRLHRRSHRFYDQRCLIDKKGATASGPRGPEAALNTVIIEQAELGFRTYAPLTWAEHVRIVDANRVKFFPSIQFGYRAISVLSCAATCWIPSASLGTAACLQKDAALRHWSVLSR